MSEVKTNKISSLASNNDITIDPDGTGDTIIASGNVGIGTASPTAKLDANGHIRVTGGTDCDIEFQSGSARRKFIGGDANNLELGTYSSSNTSRDVHMTIDSAGKLLIGTTTELFSQGVLQVKGNGAENIARFGAGANAESIVFENASGTAVGSIQVNASATAFNTSSDYRLKKEVTYNWDATTRFKELKPARFKWIADGDDAEFVDGFIAHELTAVPDAISGKGKDAVDDDGNPVLQGIDQSKLVPLLCKTILELEARITALEAE